MIPPSHDSTVIRASILDVCLQLGALDSNNPVAEWMFNDLATSSQQLQSNEPERPRKPERHGSRFHERISPTLQLEETDVLDIEVRRTPWFRRSRRSKPNGELHTEYGAEDKVRRETGISSLRSLFRRRRSEGHHDDGNMDANDIGGRPSTLALHPSHHYSGAESSDALSNHRSLPPIPASSSQATSFYGVATPVAQSVHGDGDRNDDSHNDDDWEEVEIRPQSLVYAMMLNNCLPPPKRLKKRRPKVTVEDIVEEDEQAQSVSCSLVLPRSMTPKSRKSTPRPRPLSVYSPSGTQSHRVYAHARSLSTPTPPSPSILVTPSATPQSAPSVDAYFGESPREPLLAHRPSMGYHNQFFVRHPSQPVASSPAPSLPPSSPSAHRGRQVSFSQQRIPSP